jgi:hypothetical protein
MAAAGMNSLRFSHCQIVSYWLAKSGPELKGRCAA